MKYKNKRDSMKNLFLIDFKKEKISVALVLWLFGFFLHNFLSGITPRLSSLLFIIIMFIIPAYVISALIYSLYMVLRK